MEATSRLCRCMQRRWSYGAVPAVLLLVLASAPRSAIGQPTTRPAAPDRKEKAGSDSRSSRPYGHGLAFCILAEKDPSEPGKFDEHVRSLRKRGAGARIGDAGEYRWFEIDDPATFFGVGKKEQILPEHMAKQRVLVQRLDRRYFVLGRVDPDHSLGMNAGAGGVSIENARVELQPVHKRRTVTIDLNRRDGKRLEALTRAQRGHEMGVIVGARVILHFVIQEPMSETVSVVLRTAEQAERLVRKLNPAEGASTREAPPPKPSPALAAFRILARRDPANPKQFEAYIRRLSEHGPDSPAGEQSFQWFRVYNPKAFFAEPNIDREFERRQSQLPWISGRHGKDYHVLAHVDPDHAVSISRTGENGAIEEISIIKDPSGHPALSLVLNESAAKHLHRLTQRNIKRTLAIFVNDEAVCRATIMDPVGARAMITGSFTERELEVLRDRLRAGIRPKTRTPEGKPSAADSKDSKHEG